MQQLHLRMVPLTSNALGDALHSTRQITGDTVIRLVGIPAKENHHNKRLGGVYKKVYQDGLMHPVDLSHDAPDSVALHGVFDAPARRKANLQRRVVTGGLA